MSQIKQRMGKLSLSSNVTALEQCTASQHEIYNSLDTNFPIALSADAEDRDGQEKRKSSHFLWFENNNRLWSKDLIDNGAVATKNRSLL